MAVIIKRLFYRGTGGSGGSTDASDVEYDNTSSGLTATNVQDAIDELASIADAGAYSISFTGVTWTGPVDSEYSITIPFSSHQKTNPTLSAYETSGSNLIEVEVSVLIDSSFNITVTIQAIPDLRFSGKFIII